MQYSKYTLWVIVATLCTLMTACVKTGRSSASNEEKASVNLKIGMRYLEMNMLEIAKKNLEKAADLDSSNASIYNALGILHERLNQSTVAKEYYQRATKLDKESSSSANNYGRILCISGDYEEGIAQFQKSADAPFNDKKWLAYTNMGLCQLNNKNEKAAENSFRKALKKNRKYAPALAEMQKISYHAKNYMSARAFLERYLEIKKHTSGTLWYGIQTAQSLGNVKRTEKYKAQLFQSFPTSKEALRVKSAE
ncbi:MAG: type IV pilus biogenesis/stability protein PilW [Methylococcales bacterium]|nr:type IV pilus biogenesis/stability protein PilW [Methylococcales bacterium]